MGTRRAKDTVAASTGRDLVWAGGHQVSLMGLVWRLVYALLEEKRVHWAGGLLRALEGPRAYLTALSEGPQQHEDPE